MMRHWSGRRAYGWLTQAACTLCAVAGGFLLMAGFLWTLVRFPSNPWVAYRWLIMLLGAALLTFGCVLAEHTA